MIVFCSITATFAQDNRSQMIDIIANRRYWLLSAVANDFVTVNFNEETWKKMIAEESSSVGINTIGNLALYITKYLDKTQGTLLDKMCGLGVDGTKVKSAKPVCSDQIKENKAKFHVTINAQNLKLTEETYMLFFNMVSTVALWLESSSTDGWKPKGKILNVIINSGNNEKDLGAKWNADFTTVTVTTSPFVEVAGWDSKITKELMKGVNAD